MRAFIVVFFLLFFCSCAALPRTLARQKRSLTVSCHSHVIISVCNDTSLGTALRDTTRDDASQHVT